MSGLGLPHHWATNFFLAGLCLELQANAEALSRLQLINQVCVWGGGGAIAVRRHIGCYNFLQQDGLACGCGFFNNGGAATLCSQR